jgi:transposase-like protein
MSNQRFSPEFKDEAVRQIVDRGYSVAEVSERLGVSAHSLYKWVKAVKPDKTDEQAAALIEARSEVLKLRAQLKRADVFDYIEVFYNRQRRHSHLGGVSPEAFEQASL